IIYTFVMKCIILALVPIYGCIAYDCSERKINLTSFNSLEVDHCCTELHTTAIFHFSSDGIITGLMINHTTFATHTANGNIDKNRDCQGTSNASDKGSWKNVVVP
ncbi:Uncharacterized protein FWK35_00021478, partial [Aphis craccivora]